MSLKCALLSWISASEMIFPSAAGTQEVPRSGPATTMAYNPFLLSRPSDYSVSSLLSASQQQTPTQQHHPASLQGLAAAAGSAAGHLQSPYGLSAAAAILPKLQQTVQGRAPLSDFFLPPIPRPLRCPEPPEPEVHDDPKVELESKELWDKFHEYGTEMVITKTGR